MIIPHRQPKGGGSGFVETGFLSHNRITTNRRRPPVPKPMNPGGRALVLE